MTARSITIAGRKIGPDAPPFIIAEMSGNHNQSLDRALQIVDAAANSGAHAIKLQTYTADTMTLDLDEGEFHIADLNPLWNGSSLYKLYQDAHTPWEWHAPMILDSLQAGIKYIGTEVILGITMEDHWHVVRETEKQKVNKDIC